MTQKVQRPGSRQTAQGANQTIQHLNHNAIPAQQQRLLESLRSGTVTTLDVGEYVLVASPEVNNA